MSDKIRPKIKIKLKPGPKSKPGPNQFQGNQNSSNANQSPVQQQIDIKQMVDGIISKLKNQIRVLTTEKQQLEAKIYILKEQLDLNKQEFEQNIISLKHQLKSFDQQLSVAKYAQRKAERENFATIEKCNQQIQMFGELVELSFGDNN